MDEGLREWQRSAFRRFITHSESDFLCVGTPGCGKTRFALHIAKHLRSTGRVERIIVVCPTEHLKIQWATAAHKMGIRLYPDFENKSCTYSPDFDGVAVTYASVGRSPLVFRGLCSSRTFGIFDEIHHAGDECSWGDSLKLAFSEATLRLSLSGTPFRSDNKAIPFISYDADGRSRADYSYSYADALADGVCRPVLFPHYEGDMKWSHKGKIFEHTFSDRIGQHKSAHRLKTAVDVNGQHLRELYSDADRKLDFVRETHPDAGGVAFAVDQAGAVKLRKLIAEISGEQPDLAISDDPDASKIIAGFAKSRRKWIVAVRMISEGVDIPRLRVAVYSTNVTTELAFRQAVGRLTRVIDDLDDQISYFFIPADPTLIGHARTIKDERNHQLSRIDDDDRGPDGGDDGGTRISTFLPISSTGEPDGVISDGDKVAQAEIREAENLRIELGMPSSYEPCELVKLIRRLRPESPLNGRPHIDETSDHRDDHSRVSDTTPDYVKKRLLSKAISTAVSRLVVIFEDHDEEVKHNQIFHKLGEMDGVFRDQRMQCTIDQLNSRLEQVNRWIEEANNEHERSPGE